MPIEGVMLPFDCEVGEDIIVSVGGDVVLRGRIVEVLTPGSSYKVDVQDSVLQAALRRRRGKG